MAHYSIIECEIFGIYNPLLIYSGWVESSVEKIVVESENQIVIELLFDETKSKVHFFNIRKPLLKEKKNIKYTVSVIFHDGSKEQIDEFYTNSLKRMQNRLVPGKKDSYKKAVDRKHKKELKSTVDTHDSNGYLNWIRKYERFTEQTDWDYCPLISIVMPVYNVDAKYLKACIESILNQTYQNFEICIADDCSTKQETIDTLKFYENLDDRIKVIYREKNGHISEATNSALSLAKGEFIGLMDNDDALMPQALNEVVAVLNRDKDLDFIYSDEDKIDPNGKRSDPHFKPDFALEKLYGGNYICHFSVIRKEIVDKVGGFRKGYEGAQDFDLFIRIAQITEKFYHIPKILYHWRMIPGSTAVDAGQKNYAGEAGKRALIDLFEKKGLDVQVDIVISTHYFVQYILKEEPSIAVLMPIYNIDFNLLKKINKMEKYLSYRNFKFVFFTEFAKELESEISNVIKKHNYQIIFSNSGNLTKQINDYVNKTDVKVLVFFNENSEFRSFDAFEVLSGYALQPNIGFVGCKIINRHHLLTDTGYFLLENKLLPANYLTYMNNYGYNGNLLVPNNYRVIEDKCFAIETKKLKEHMFSEEFETFEEAFVFNCLFFDKKSFKSIVIPNIKVFVNQEETQIQVDMKDILNQCNNHDIQTIYDKYYNTNLSKLYGFRLDK